MQVAECKAAHKGHLPHNLVVFAVHGDASLCGRHETTLYQIFGNAESDVGRGSRHENHGTTLRREVSRDLAKIPFVIGRRHSRMSEGSPGIPVTVQRPE